MPNYCDNTLVIVSPKNVWDNTLEKLLFVDYKDNEEKTPTYHRRFSFGALLPQPQELINTTAPANVVSQEEYDEWYAEWLQVPEDDFRKNFGRKITEEMSNDLISKYGFNNWYDWRYSKWGVKWDADTYNIDVEEKKDRSGIDIVEATINFTTPWSPAERWFATLCDNIRGFGVFMEMRFAEEGMGFAGTQYFDNDAQWEADGCIYPVDEKTGLPVFEKDGLWRNSLGQFVSSDSVVSHISYDENDLGG